MSAGTTRVGVSALALHAQQLLLTQRMPGRGSADEWTLPGGAVASGEHPRDALGRELAGTGSRVTALEPVGSDSRVLSARPDGESRPIHLVRICYLVQTASQTGVMGRRSGDSAWVAVDDLPGVDEVVAQGLMLVGSVV